MSRIAECFSELAENQRTALIPYLTAGDPHPGATVGFMHTLVAAGANIIELGVPFTDPMADGPVIQSACERALAHDTCLRDVLDMVAEFRNHDTTTPVVLMGYLNPIDAMGIPFFAARAEQAGVDGVLIVDMTVEEAPDIVPALTAAHLDPVCLVAPTSSAQRMARICENAAGFVYYVSLKGVTGAASLDTHTLAERLAPLRAATHLPVGVGFGVRTADDAAVVATVADAVIVGSALVRLIAEGGDNLDETARNLHATLASMREAMDAGHKQAREGSRA